jgi:hypothetical protein
VLRALEETAAAQTKAAHLCQDTLAACRAERANVREERAADNRAEEKKKVHHRTTLKPQIPNSKAFDP